MHLSGKTASFFSNVLKKRSDCEAVVQPRRRCTATLHFSFRGKMPDRARRLQNGGINIDIKSYSLGLLKVTPFHIDGHTGACLLQTPQNRRPPPTPHPSRPSPTETPRLVFLHSAPEPSSDVFSSPAVICSMSLPCRMCREQREHEGERWQRVEGGGASDILPAPDPARSSRYSPRRRG